MFLSAENARDTKEALALDVTSPRRGVPMSRYSLTHLSDDVLLRDLATLTTRERGTTAEGLAHIAEAAERKLYLPAAYPSMIAYCIGALRFSDATPANP